MLLTDGLPLLRRLDAGVCRLHKHLHAWLVLLDDQLDESTACIVAGQVPGLVPDHDSGAAR